MICSIPLFSNYVNIIFPDFAKSVLHFLTQCAILCSQG
nr:MAG TPA: hypothetical protein [Caudoviricetes sp.]